jgi:hypothetical protein
MFACDPPHQCLYWCRSSIRPVVLSHNKKIPPLNLNLNLQQQLQLHVREPHNHNQQNQWTMLNPKIHLHRWMRNKPRWAKTLFHLIGQAGTWDDAYDTSSMKVLECELQHFVAYVYDGGTAQPKR